MKTRIIIFKKICIRTISQNYWSELSVRTIGLNYQSELSARTIGQNYRSELSVRTIGLNYQSELSVRSVSQNYQPELSVRTISQNYQLELLVLNPPLCKIHILANPPLYITNPFEAIMPWLNSFWFRKPNGRTNLSKFQPHISNCLSIRPIGLKGY